MGHETVAEAMRVAKARRGAVTVELLVICGVIGLVAVACAAKWGKAARATRIQLAREQIVEFSRAMWLYYFDTGAFPADSEGLLVLVRDPGAAGWRGPYLEAGQLPRDPWDREYRYLGPVTDTGRRTILSAGPDGEFGTADDIGVSLVEPLRKEPGPRTFLVGQFHAGLVYC